MSDYYYRFLSSMAGVGGQSTPIPHHPPLPCQQQPPPVIAMSSAPMQNSYQSLGYFTGFPEPIMPSASKAQRSRRRSSGPGLDHVKHRRTRSGCYTCRARRVKCDEAHPICERCRKGKRDCVYPEPVAPKGSNTQSSKDSGDPSQQGSPASSPGDGDGDEGCEGDDGGDEGDEKLEPILDEEEEEKEEEEEAESATASTAPCFPLRRSSTASSFGFQRGVAGFRQGSETPSYDGTRSSPSLSTGTATTLTPIASSFADIAWQPPGTRPDFGFLPQDLQFYLNYFFDKLTAFHYKITHDPNDFFRTFLVTVAVQDETLLYAVVAFAVYNHSLQNPNGVITDFLHYYNRSVKMLLHSLQKKEKGTIATLLTILQLATIEEYLGDWVNLMGHQKAAFEILCRLCTPQSIMQSPLGRMVLNWYGRFDLLVALMGSFQVVMPREWFSNAVAFYRSMTAAEPDSIAWKMEDSAARLRLITVDMSSVVSRGASGELDWQAEEYLAEHFRITQMLNGWRETIDPALTDPTFLVRDLGIDRPRDPNEVVDPLSSGALWAPPLFPVTILICEWHSIMLMHYSQILDKQNVNVPPDAVEHALAILGITEAVEGWPSSPRGSLIMLQGCLTIAAFFAPRDPRYYAWVRRKLALLETMGYISPITIRTRMSELFREPSCVRWWLPNDEGFTPFLQSARLYADERNKMAVTAQSENLRQIRHVFSRMRLNAFNQEAPVNSHGGDSKGGPNMA